MQTVTIDTWSIIAGTPKQPRGYVRCCAARSSAVEYMRANPALRAYLKRERVTVTRDQIRKLCDEAGAAGDLDTARICHHALTQGGRRAMRDAAICVWHAA